MADDPDDIEAWQRIDARTSTSGKLVDADIPRLAAIGVRHVINLAPDDRPGALPDEAAKLAGAGIRYSHIPVPFDAPGEDQFRQFVTAYQADDEPVHIHCIANYRVSAFLYRYHRDVAGMDETAARGLMERQWSPGTSDSPTVRVWADFIAKGEN